MRSASHVTIKKRDYFGRVIELATWQMMSAGGGYAAGYYYGADLLFVRYGYTEEEATELVDKAVDAMVNPVSNT